MAFGLQTTSSSEKATGQNPILGVREGDMDADELIDDYLTPKINRTKHEAVDWQAYTDPFTGRQVWYDQQLDWDQFGGNGRPFNIFETTVRSNRNPIKQYEGVAL